MFFYCYGVDVLYSQRLHQKRGREKSHQENGTRPQLFKQKLRKEGWSSSSKAGDVSTLHKQCRSLLM